MPHSKHQPDLSGSAPDQSPVALLIVDVINDFDFPHADELLAGAKDAALAIAGLRRKAREAGVPVIYINDNFGRWRSDFRSLVENCLAPSSKGKEIVQILRPGEEDYFVLKPKHSAFYSTALEVLLEHLGVGTLILTGIAGNSCVFATATDAYMRDYRLLVPRDCVASEIRAENEAALLQMEKILKADIRPSRAIQFPLPATKE